MWPAVILVTAAYIPGDIKRTLKHPMLVGVKLWAVAHLISNGDLGSIILFGSILAWAVYDRITLKRRSDPGAPPIPLGGRRNDIARHHRRDHPLFRARPRVPSARDRAGGVRHAGARNLIDVDPQPTQRAPDRARHPRPQGRRADRHADVLSRPYGAHPRPALRRHPGRRFARHGDARARDHHSGDARHDDPAGARGDARLAARAGRRRPAVRLLRGLEGAGLHAAARVLKETGCGAIKLEGGRRMAETIALPGRARRAGDGPCRAHAAIRQRARRLPRPGPRPRRLGADRGRCPRGGGGRRLLRWSLEAWRSRSPRRSRATSRSPPSASARAPPATARCWCSRTCSACRRGCRNSSSATPTLGPSIEAAVSAYAAEVRSRSFPGPENVYAVKRER